MIFSFAQIIQLVLQYRYHLLFPLMIVEGPIITVIGGFLSSLGYFNAFTIYLAAVIGDFIGDTLYYAAGYYGRKSFIERWGHYAGITAKRVARLEGHFQRHSGKTLVLGKLSQGIGAVILVTAGAAKMKYWKFIGYNMVATIPKSFILLLIGFYFGQAYSRISRYMDYTALITIALAVLFTLIYLIIKKVSKKYSVNGVH